ncbi:MAG: GUN4 domain-containing protein [Cyanobacteria bacterium P01_B01_bin.77]
MHSIFISYRRRDSQADAGRIYDRLAVHFGKNAVFKDVDDIPPGVDFRDYLSSMLNQCSVVVAIIGPTWLNATDGQGRRRLDNSTDWVRIEIQEALNRSDTLVIPLLVSHADMPRGDELPDGLKDLAYRNCREIRPDPDFHRDISRLIDSLEKYFEPAAQQKSTGVKAKSLSDISDISISRQQFLKWGGFSSVGLIAASGIRHFSAANESVPDDGQLSEAEYTQLEELLKAKKWKEADAETLDLMLKIADRESERYLEEEEPRTFPCRDLRKLDQLWLDASDGKFGFSTQARIYLDECFGDWTCFIDKVGWRTDREFTKYSEVIFDIDAPTGHLPYGGECGKREPGTSCFTYSMSIISLFARVKTCNI